MKESVESLFGAHLLKLLWPDVEDVNQQLKELILEKSKMIESISQSNKGGWQSPKDLQYWEHASVKRFLMMAGLAVSRLMTACIGDNIAREMETRWKIVAWANVNGYSNYNGLHNHGGGFWSGVYYVSAGRPNDDDSQEGSISFRNPTLAPLAVGNLGLPETLREIFPTKHEVKPLEGLMLLFPSWLEHYVHPYFGKEPRISISWDIVFPR